MRSSKSPRSRLQATLAWQELFNPLHTSKYSLYTYSVRLIIGVYKLDLVIQRLSAKKKNNNNIIIIINFWTAPAA